MDPLNQNNTSQAPDSGQLPAPAMNINDLIKTVNDLLSAFSTLKNEYYRNNFAARQDFNKTVTFNTKLKIPHYAVAPSTCEVGEIIEISGILRICSAANTWTKVGTQT